MLVLPFAEYIYTYTSGDALTKDCVYYVLNRCMEDRGRHRYVSITNINPTEHNKNHIEAYIRDVEFYNPDYMVECFYNSDNISILISK
jgi:hypothetical protein